MSTNVCFQQTKSSPKVSFVVFICLFDSVFSKAILSRRKWNRSRFLLVKFAQKQSMYLIGNNKKKKKKNFITHPASLCFFFSCHMLLTHCFQHSSLKYSLFFLKDIHLHTKYIQSHPINDNTFILFEKQLLSYAQTWRQDKFFFVYRRRSTC